MMAKPSGMALIAIVVIVALLMSTQIMAGFTNLLDRGWDLWGDLWNFGKEVGGQGFTGLGMKINYADGTSKEYEPSSMSVIPLTIYDDGKEVDSIEPFVVLTVDWDGDLSDWTMTLSTKAHITGIDEPLYGQFNMHFDQASKGTLVDGEPKQFSIGKKSASVFNGLLVSSDKDTGTYTAILELFNVDVDLTINGETHSRWDLSAQTTWTFQYDKGADIKSLSIEMLVGSIYV